MSKCVIIGASPDAYWDGRWTPDLVICADGGSRKAAFLGLKPHLVIGDGDSRGNEAFRSYLKTINLPPDKNMTDMEACLDYAIMEHGVDDIALLGATGGRLDHFLGNIGLLERSQGRAFILDAGHEIRLVNCTLTLTPPHRYRYFSLVPLDETVSGVTIQNVKYPLKDAVLRRGTTLGVSNEPLGNTAFTVSVNNGKSLLILSGKL